MNTEDIKNFINLSYLEVYLSGNKCLSVGLKFGESKRLKPLFSRKKQIELLNHIQDNFILYQDLILNTSEIKKC